MKNNSIKKKFYKTENSLQFFEISISNFQSDVPYTSCILQNFSWLFQRPCLHLWCTDDIDRGCETNHMPWADGTHCGQGM